MVENRVGDPENALRELELCERPICEWSVADTFLLARAMCLLGEKPVWKNQYIGHSLAFGMSTIDFDLMEVLNKSYLYFPYFPLEENDGTDPEWTSTQVYEWNTAIDRLRATQENVFNSPPTTEKFPDIFALFSGQPKNDHPSEDPRIRYESITYSLNIQGSIAT